MSSTTSHFVIGAVLAVPIMRNRDLADLLPSWSIPVGAGLLAAAPDLDLVGKRLFGIYDSSILSHRGFFHSPFFMIVFAAAIAAVVSRDASRRAFAALWLAWGGAMLTHPLLDALSNGGAGIMLLLPFSRARCFFHWRPIFNPGGSGEPLFRRAWFIRGSEIPFCLAAVAITGLILVLHHSFSHPRTGPDESRCS